MSKVKCEIRKLSIIMQFKDWESIAKVVSYLSEIDQISLITYKVKEQSNNKIWFEIYMDSTISDKELCNRIAEDGYFESIRGLYAYNVFVKIR